jgi:pimeloyl-ACP methyl ester carboxylesterase
MIEKKILIEDLKVNYKIAGEGFPFLILHGWGGSSSSWVEVQKRLSNKGYKVVSLDLPGFGKTSSPLVPWEIRDYSNFILNFIEKLKLGKIILLGHSFGGRISIKFASLYPEKLEKLFLFASAGIKHPWNFRKRIIYIFAGIGNFLLSPKFLRRVKDLARNIFYILIRQRDYRKAKGAMRETFKKVVDEDLASDLSKISTKTLIVWGEKDNAVPLKDAYFIKEKIPTSVLEIIPKVGHTANLEAPEKLSEIILKFLEKKND